jgi:hypothetical protein
MALGIPVTAMGSFLEGRSGGANSFGIGRTGQTKSSRELGRIGEVEKVTETICVPPLRRAFVALTTEPFRDRLNQEDRVKPKAETVQLNDIDRYYESEVREIPFCSFTAAPDARRIGLMQVATFSCANIRL